MERANDQHLSTIKSFCNIMHNIIKRFGVSICIFVMFFFLGGGGGV